MRGLTVVLAATLLGGTLPAAVLAQTPASGRALGAPPAAPVRPVTDDYHGTKVVDPYRYMEDLKDPEVQGWMKAQAEYTRAVLGALPGRAALRGQIEALWQSVDTVVTDVQIVGGHYYTLRILLASPEQFKLYAREGVSGADRLLIDPERLPGGAGGRLSIAWYRPSHDNRYVAYGVTPTDGSEAKVLHIFDTRTGQDLPEIADSVGSPPAWRADNRSFFYTRYSSAAPERSTTAAPLDIRAYLHELGHPFDDDPVILGRGTRDAAIELQPEEEPYIDTSARSRYAVAVIQQGTDSRVRVYTALAAALDGADPAWRPIAPRYEDEFIAENELSRLKIALHGDTLYWLSRKDAPRGRILALDLSTSNSEPRIVVPEGELPIAEIYAAGAALYWRVSDAGIHALHRMRYANGARPEILSLPYPADVDAVMADAASDAVVLSAGSWVRDPKYLGVDAPTGRVAEIGLEPANPSDTTDQLTVDEVRVRSWDGTLVPLSIVYKRGLERDGSHITRLTGYGSYGIILGPQRDGIQRILAGRGLVSATCHVRGGGELGEAWHRGGFQETKPNTWKDFIACAEYLVAHGYTRPEKLVVQGGSAGGILVGRAIEERPDLFAAAIAEVPVADMLRFETTENGFYNTTEFGSVKNEAGFRALHVMSPYANVRDGVKYPAVLITTGMNDPRVAPWLPAKFAARLQAATASGKPVLLRVDYDAGHYGGASVEQALTKLMDQLTFLLWQTGDPEFQPERAATAPGRR